MLDEREPGSLSLGALVERGPAESRLSFSSFEAVMLNLGTVLNRHLMLAFARARERGNLLRRLAAAAHSDRRNGRSAMRIRATFVRGPKCGVRNRCEHVP